MTTARNKELDATMREYERDAASETIRQLLEQTEQLSLDADLTEVAFLIGVALASLAQESPPGRDFGTIFGTNTRIM